MREESEDALLPFPGKFSTGAHGWYITNSNVEPPLRYLHSLVFSVLAFQSEILATSLEVTHHTTAHK